MSTAGTRERHSRPSSERKLVCFSLHNGTVYYNVMYLHAPHAQDAELQTLANSSSQDKTSLMTEVQSLMEMVERLQQEKIEREHTIQPQAALPGVCGVQ